MRDHSLAQARSDLPAQKERLAGLGRSGRGSSNSHSQGTTSVWKCEHEPEWAAGAGQGQKGPVEVLQCKNSGGPDRTFGWSGSNGLKDTQRTERPPVRAPPKGDRAGDTAVTEVGTERSQAWREAGTQALENPRATPGNTGSREGLRLGVRSGSALPPAGALGRTGNLSHPQLLSDEACEDQKDQGHASTGGWTSG